jgi:hypothetical protein
LKPTRTSAGAAKVAELVKRHGARAVGRRIGLSHAAVRKIVEGAAPRSETREKLRTVYGIPPEAFDVTPPAPPPATRASSRSAPEGTPASEVDSRAELVAMVRQLRGELDRLKADPQATSRERAQVVSAMTAALRLVAKLDGAGEITQGQLLRSAAWKRCAAVIVDAARNFPGACEAIGKALRNLEAEGG